MCISLDFLKQAPRWVKEGTNECTAVLVSCGILSLFSLTKNMKAFGTTNKKGENYELKVDLNR